MVRIAVRIDAHGGQARPHPLRRWSGASSATASPSPLLRCFPETGRQHQIRIHAREAGFPLVGDKIYGPDPGYFDRFSKRCLEPEAWARLRLPRHALHAARLAFPHPVTGAGPGLRVATAAGSVGFLPRRHRGRVEVGGAATSTLLTAA